MAETILPQDPFDDPLLDEFAREAARERDLEADHHSPQERIRCACPSWSSPSECVRIRYGKNPTGSDPGAEIEECECACHVEEEEDDE